MPSDGNTSHDKVYRQANPAWIELRVMYVRSTVTDRHARWVIINQKVMFVSYDDALPRASEVDINE
jgi:hypothetical protein